MAVSCGMFCISVASLSGVTTRTNQVPSDARYTFIAALAGWWRSCSPKKLASHSAAWIDTLADQTPSARSDVVTYSLFAGRSRRYSAVTIAEYRPTAVALSPLPATGQVGGAPASRVMDNKPLRAQHAVMSKPGQIGVGPYLA